MAYKGVYFRLQTLTIGAYAKINLTLRVLGQRPDGFHELSTILQNIALHDRITLNKSSKGIRLRVSGAPLTAGVDNLAYKAATALQKKYNFPGVDIDLEKKIPLAAGLGGGSADAAATLLGINYLYGLGLTPGQLSREGAALGSDVPFCVLGGTALGRGRGEELSLLPPPAKLWLVLVKPDFGVSAARAYKNWDTYPRWRTLESPDERAAIEALKIGDRQQLKNALGNELEGVVCQLYPQIETIKNKLLNAGAERVIMCGSGPTVFGLAVDQAQAEHIAAQLKGIYSQVIVSHTL